MNKYLKIKNLSEQLKCAECHGTGDYNPHTPPLNDSEYTIMDRHRGDSIRFLGSDICAGCEGTGFNVMVTYQNVGNRIRRKLYE